MKEEMQSLAALALCNSCNICGADLENLKVPATATHSTDAGTFYCAAKGSAAEEACV